MSLSTTYKQFLNTFRDGDSTTSLGSLFQCLTTFSVNKFFLMSNLNLPWHNLRPFPLILSPVTSERRIWCVPVSGVWQNSDPSQAFPGFTAYYSHKSYFGYLTCTLLDVLLYTRTQNFNRNIWMKAPRDCVWAFVVWKVSGLCHSYAVFISIFSWNIFR